MTLELGYDHDVKSQTGRGSLHLPLGRTFALMLPVVVVLVALEMSGLPSFVILAVFLGAPFAAALVPSIARRWPEWGEAFGVACTLAGTIVAVHYAASWGPEMLIAVAVGFYGLLLRTATARIARRRAAAA